MRERIKIQNFGAIKNGYLRDNGYLTMNKVTVLTGPQASGKSTVAKLFSLFTWLEKSIVRGETSVDYVAKYNRFVKVYCAYHGLTNYFSPATYIDYLGKACRMTYKDGKFSIDVLLTQNDYVRPKVMYIPAERNLISVLDNAENVKGLPDSMVTLLSRYVTACKRSGTRIQLPLENVSFRYDKLNKIAWIEDGGHSLRLNETASGIQSLTPLFVVLDDLAHHLQESSSKSIKEQNTINKRVEELLADPTLSPEVRKALLAQVTDVSNKRLVSVVEEPEQNLFPTSQREMINSLLSINSAVGNQLLLTTHSPFVINYLALAIKAADIAKDDTDNVSKLSKVVPSTAMVAAEDINVYDIDAHGAIHDVLVNDGVLTDDNVLNHYLQESNDLFNDLLDIEEDC